MYPMNMFLIHFNQSQGLTAKVMLFYLPAHILTLLVAAVVGYLRDLREILTNQMGDRARTEGALRESEENFRMLFATEPDALMVFYPDTLEFIEVNEAAIKLYGYTREEFLKIKLSDITAELEQTRRAVREAAEGRLKKIEIRYHRKKDGSKFPVEVSASRFTTRGRSVLYGAIRDITQRLQVEEALRESEEKLREKEQQYRTLAESSLDFIYILDLDGTIRYVNQAGADVFRAKPHQMINQRQEEFFPPDQVARHLAALRQVRETKRNRISEDLLPGGVWVDARLVPVFNPEGEVTQVLGISRDITGRKQIEAELQKYREQLEVLVRERTTNLESINKDLEAFSYSVSHDLRAPLQVIFEYSQELLEESREPLPGEAQRSIQRIFQASQRMRELIEDLLNLSRITQADIKKEPADLSAMAVQTVMELRHQAPARVVSFDIAPGVIVQGDGRMLRIVMENLLGNAWKFTGHHPQARIEFGLAVRDGQTVYFVRDDGAGFNMEYAGKLFHPFKRLHSPAEFKGSGIGLVTVQRVIERHGGKVWAEGVVEKGATFYFTLG
jgi:PAS domain S-box-containing protein